MLETLFPLFFGGTFIFLLVRAFRLMRLPTHDNPTPSNVHKDRTGLITTHPEIIDEAGKITTEDLLAVRFTDPSDYATSTDSTP